MLSSLSLHHWLFLAETMEIGSVLAVVLLAVFSSLSATYGQNPTEATTGELVLPSLRQSPKESGNHGQAPDLPPAEDVTPAVRVSERPMLSDAVNLGGLIGKVYQNGELTLLPGQTGRASSSRQPILLPGAKVNPGAAGTKSQPGASVNVDNPVSAVYRENRVVPGLIQEQWAGVGRLNLTCQQVLWPTQLLDLCDFDPLYRIVGQRAPSVGELLKLTRHYAGIYAQILAHSNELCADAAVEHICQQQVPRCEQSSVNPVTGMAVWSLATVSSQCYQVRRHCVNPAAKQVLSRLQVCHGGGMITGRYELNTCKAIGQIHQRSMFRPPMRSCAARMSPRIRVPDFQLPLYQKDWEMNQHIAQLQQAATSGMLPLLCRQAVLAFSCAPEQRCTADGRRLIPGRTKEQCRAVENW